MKYLICLFYAINFQSNAREYCKKVTKLKSEPADYYIIGLFPIYDTAPSIYDQNGLQYSEVH